ncbi:MAG: DNA recombination protein RmuC [Chitinispirillaceae bacterium]|nr:DNA recombination protein RmuC [Chitinispirillaceae bacterium]
MNTLALSLLLGLLTVNTTLLAALLIRTFSRPHAGLRDEVMRELQLGRKETADSSRDLREEVSNGIRSTGETISRTLGDIANLQKVQLEGVARRLETLTETNQNAQVGLRDALNERMAELRKSNETKLEEMRRTVDEKLQTTLEKRLGESFKLVSERLEAVQRGLGEMQGLANGVGDLKRVLTNVKARGTWGEYQLGAILEQILTPDQYQKNVHTKEHSADVVEYAIKLPGRGADDGSCVWLPIDSKFPQEDYQRLLDAVDKADRDGVDKAAAALMRAIKGSAKAIHDTYINPPATTDFAILFLPTEGLYAEVLRQPGFVEEVQLSARVVVAGPTTLSAILSSLRMGFRTLAIEQRASEVWKILAAVKTEFGRFGVVIDKVKKQLSVASNTLEQTSTRTRAMERQLRNVEQMPQAQARELFAPDNGSEEDEPGEDAGPIEDVS